MNNIELVEIPGGTFIMGSPLNEKGRDIYYGSPQHEVTVPDFWIGKYPVTQAEWRFVAGLEPINRRLNPDPSHFKWDISPVEQVSWEDATEFCARLSAHTKQRYRLPTEAEWEYACRAGTTTPFNCGNKITKSDANFDYYGTTEVGRFPPNKLGLYDMHGNVWEWCQDHWHDDYKDSPTDGSALEEDAQNKRRVLRGGCWGSLDKYCRSYCRYSSFSDFFSDDIGFRVACSAVIEGNGEL